MTGVPFTHRRLAPDDADRYVALRTEMLHDAPWAFLASPGNDRGSDPAGLRASLARDDFAIHAAFAAERMIAAAGVVREPHAKRAHLATIWGVYVTPDARGQGAGAAVVKAAIATARGWQGVAGIRLSVSARAAAARRLYQRLGFSAWGIEPDAIRIDGNSFDEIHMGLSFVNYVRE